MVGNAKTVQSLLRYFWYETVGSPNKMRSRFTFNVENLSFVFNVFVIDLAFVVVSVWKVRKVAASSVRRIFPVTSASGLVIAVVVRVRSLSYKYY